MQEDAAFVEAEPECEDAGPDIVDLLEQARSEQVQLLDINERLQRHIRLALDLRRRTQDDDDNKLGTAEARYMSLRKTLIEQHAKLQATEQHYDSTIVELRDVLQERLARSSTISQVRKNGVYISHNGCAHSFMGLTVTGTVYDSSNRKDARLPYCR